jgi:hypothetical protein
MESGDQVAFYECGKGKAVVGRGRKPRGRQGVVRVATIVSELRQKGFEEQYTDGTVGRYEWEVPCDQHDESGFAGRIDVCRAVGFKVGYKLYGLGGGTGVKELNQEQFERLLAEFRGNVPRPPGSSRLRQ